MFEVVATTCLYSCFSDLWNRAYTDPPGLCQRLLSVGCISDRRVEKETDQDTRRICRAVLRWLACATRPLLVDEVWEALRIEYTSGTMENEDFFLTCREMVNSCGSLVREENETLQLAHLSLSEFLRKSLPTTQQNRQMQEFLVDNSVTNSRLALTSIEYISACSTHHPVSPHDKFRRLQSARMIERYPLLDYAVSNWLIHLANGELICRQVAPTVLSTFCLSFPMLFWLEVWFSIDRHNLWQLEQQIQRIATFMSSEQLGGEQQRKRHPFVHRWAIAMLQLLARHGSCCEEEPSYMHFVDPASFEEDSDGEGLFAQLVSNGVQLKTKYARLHTKAHQSRNKFMDDMRLSKSSKIHPSPRASPAFGVFYFDQQRNVIFLADSMSSVPKLFCQDATTARTLSPIAHPYDRGRIYWCEGYTFSKDGRYLAIYHKSYPHTDEADSKDEKHHIVLWEIAEQLDFDHLTPKPWCTARRSISRKIQSPHYSPQPLAFDEDHTLLCPYGRINISSDLEDDHMGPLIGTSSNEVNDSRANGASGGLAFSADSSTIVVCDTKLKELVKMQANGTNFDTTVQLPTSEVIICCISPKGRYAVWRELKVLKTCFLHDFFTNTTNCLQGSEGILFPTHSLLSFSTDEDCLFGIVTPLAEADFRKRYVSVWTDLSRQPKQMSSPLVGEILGFHFTTLQDPAYLATSEFWAEIDPSKLQTLPNGFFRRDLATTQQVSLHGDRLAVFWDASEIPEGPK